MEEKCLSISVNHVCCAYAAEMKEKKEEESKHMHAYGLPPNETMNADTENISFRKRKTDQDQG